jgi:RecB family exonuclease
LNAVISVLREHIANQDARFVFPSQTAAGLWARKTCTLGIARSVAANRFLAWDRFKEEVFGERDAERAPASSALRKLFADALVRKNAKAVLEAGDASPGGGPGTAEGFPFKALIPADYARGGGTFAPFIARFLPSLARWEKLAGKASGAKGIAPDAEDLDYGLVRKEYAAFLDTYGYFEPSWEEVKLRETGACYVLFFPELIEDFDEYDGLLDTPQFIRIRAETSAPPREEKLVSYKSAREEIRSAVVEMERLHKEEGFPYEDMAVSVPGLEEVEPYLLKELSLRHIPAARRAGKPLGGTGAGRLFSLINECAASRFSFNSLKALILDAHIPWKDRKKNKGLVRFGIEFNCVSAYAQDGAAVDIWEEAFREAGGESGWRGTARELGPYYRELKKRVLALAGSSGFAGIRKSYFAFRGAFLDMNAVSGDDDAVLSRCVEELGSLIELEEKLNNPELVPASPYAFFLSCLNETEYVKAGRKPGVNIFRWRVAAASPFCCHFVLNASQSAASVLYQPMKFLRQDKRKRLGFEDRDATGAFFVLCGTGEDDCFKSRTRISASAQTFSGWAIPHCFFAQNMTEDAPEYPPDGHPTDIYPMDPYAEERRFWRAAETSGGELRALYPLQKESFNLWKDALVRKENSFSFFDFPVPADKYPSEPVRELLETAVLGADGFLTVTPTNDLNVYYKCPLFWLYERILKIREFLLEAALLDETSLGRLYHKILEELFARIKAEDETFKAGRLGVYKRWALDITESVIKEEKAFKGPLAVPLVSPQAAGMAKKLAGILSLEAKNFDGYTIAELELPVRLKTGGLLIKGVIDRVSVSPAGEPVIIDYKTGDPPKQTAPDKPEESPLSEFQMPLYIRLLEEMSAAEGRESVVRGALFYSINGCAVKAVVGEKAGGRSKAPGREEYSPYLAAAEKQIEEFGNKVKALDFTPREVHAADCFACIYKTVCRTAYSH